MNPDELKSFAKEYGLVTKDYLRKSMRTIALLAAVGYLLFGLTTIVVANRINDRVTDNIVANQISSCERSTKNRIQGNEQNRALKIFSNEFSILLRAIVPSFEDPALAKRAVITASSLQKLSDTLQDIPLEECNVYEE